MNFEQAPGYIWWILAAFVAAITIVLLRTTRTKAKAEEKPHCSCEDDDGFTIRIRFRIPANKLGIEESEVTVGASSNGSSIRLSSIDRESPIKDSEWLILVCEGWESKEESEQNSEQLLHSLCRSLSYHNLSADFGRRTPGGGFFRGFLDQLKERTGRNVLNDAAGIMIYATALKPKFARLNPPTAYISVNEDQWKNTFQRALKINQPFSDRESMAFDLFTMAHKVRQSADARFVLLFAAFETLLEPAKRPKATRDHVDGLIEDTKKSILSEEEKKSLVGSLKYLRGKSINSSARELVRTRLGDETLFGGIPAGELYKKSYKLRNRLLHGNLPFPDWQEVSSVVGPFEQMVSKLISGDLIT